MKAKEINPAKIKIFFELVDSKTIKESESAEVLPEIKKISAQHIFFEREINIQQFSLIKRINILLYTLGRWKEYPVAHFNLIDKHKRSQMAESSISLSIMVDDREEWAFKNDLLMALR